MLPTFMTNISLRIKETFIQHFSVIHSSPKSRWCEKRGTVGRFSHRCIPVKEITCILYWMYECTRGRSIWLVVSYGMDACFRGFCGLFHQSKKGNVHVSASSQQWKCARLWMGGRLHTWRVDYLPCILVLSSFSPFHRFFPQKLSFNSFEGGISWLTFFVEWVFLSVTFTSGTLAKVKLLFYNTHTILWTKQNL